MASFLQRWEREKKRIEKSKGWLTYQWEDLKVLDPAKLDFLQQRMLNISSFKNDEGRELGRNYGEGFRKKWIGFRQRLKPFYIYKNKLLLYWKPNFYYKSKGDWNIVAYDKINSYPSKRERVAAAIEAGVGRPQDRQILRNLEDRGDYRRGRFGVAGEHAPDYVDLEGEKLYTGGSVRNEVGSSQLHRQQWTDDGELKTLKDAKIYAENIYKLASINTTYFRWLVDENESPPEDWDQDKDGSFYDYLPFTMLEDWQNIIVRPKSVFIINWTNHAPTL